MNFTSKRPKENDTWTTSRYLLPPISKMSRLGQPTEADHAEATEARYCTRSRNAKPEGSTE